MDHHGKGGKLSTGAAVFLSRMRPRGAAIGGFFRWFRSARSG